MLQETLKLAKLQPCQRQTEPLKCEFPVIVAAAFAVHRLDGNVLDDPTFPETLG